MNFTPKVFYIFCNRTPNGLSLFLSLALSIHSLFFKLYIFERKD